MDETIRKSYSLEVLFHIMEIWQSALLIGIKKLHIWRKKEGLDIINWNTVIEENNGTRGEWE